MKIAYAYWNGRIAPVFDSAQQIHVVDSNDGKIVSEQQHMLPNNAPFQKAAELDQLGIQTLVCGAISRPLHEWLITRGINVVAFIAGELREVIQAQLKGTLENTSFAMPGCGRRMRGRRRGMSAGLGSGSEFGANCEILRGMELGGSGGAGKGNRRGMGRGRNKLN